VSEIPDDLRYTADHEWAKLIDGNKVRVGITDYAQASLGDIVFVSVHELGAAVAPGDTFGEVESTKRTPIPTARAGSPRSSWQTPQPSKGCWMPPHTARQPRSRPLPRVDPPDGPN
jgi:hypothetical protein